MGNRLYVGNLPYSFRDETLLNEFKSLGLDVVSAKVLMERDSGRSKGFGFVEFSNDEDAQKGIDELNGKDIGGRALVVNEAKPMKPLSDRTHSRSY